MNGGGRLFIRAEDDNFTGSERKKQKETKRRKRGEGRYVGGLGEMG